MGSKIWLINGILAVVAAFFCIRAFDVWGDDPRSSVEVRAVDRSAAKPRPATPRGITARSVAPESNYESVVSKNLFSPERKTSLSEEGEQELGDDWENSTEGRELLERVKGMTLYGVVITDDSKSALVVADAAVQERPAAGIPKLGMAANIPAAVLARRQAVAAKIPGGLPAASLARGEKTEAEWVRVGDSLSAFTVADILADRVVLKAGSRDMDLLMYDKDKPKSRAPVVQKTPEKDTRFKETRADKDARPAEGGKGAENLVLEDKGQEKAKPVIRESRERTNKESTKKAGAQKQDPRKRKDTDAQRDKTLQNILKGSGDIFKARGSGRNRQSMNDSRVDR